jgi:hypothetical protein
MFLKRKIVMPGSKGKGNGVGVEQILATNAWFATHKNELHNLTRAEISKRIKADTGMTIGSRTIIAMRKQHEIRSRTVGSPGKTSALKRLAAAEARITKLIEISIIVHETMVGLGEASAARRIESLLASKAE